MSLADRHSHKTRVVCVHNVDMKVICGRETMQSFTSVTGAENEHKDGTYNNWADNGQRDVALSLLDPSEL